MQRMTLCRKDHILKAIYFLAKHIYVCIYFRKIEYPTVN
jgi:hypothetical protein